MDVVKVVIIHLTVFGFWFRVFDRMTLNHTSTATWTHVDTIKLMTMNSQLQMDIIRPACTSPTCVYIVGMHVQPWIFLLAHPDVTCFLLADLFV